MSVIAGEGRVSILYGSQPMAIPPHRDGYVARPDTVAPHPAVAIATGQSIQRHNRGRRRLFDAAQLGLADAKFVRELDAGRLASQLVAQVEPGLGCALDQGAQRPRQGIGSTQLVQYASADAVDGIGRKR